MSWLLGRRAETGNRIQQPEGEKWGTQNHQDRTTGELFLTALLAQKWHDLESWPPVLVGTGNATYLKDCFIM